MAAFSYDKHHSYLLDSSLTFMVPDATTNMSCFSEQSIHDVYKPYFSPHDQHRPFIDQADPTVDVLSSVNASTGSTSITKISTGINNSSSSELKGKKPSKETAASSNIDEGCIGLRSEGKLDNKRRTRRSGDNDKKKRSSGAETKRSSAPTGYVYVRARRGQATDSHSLAERVRREQIRERMELLQALVPGCDKISGKALMLDHVINYVQTLQNQIELLSLKIASISPMYNDYGMKCNAYMVEPEVQNQRTMSLEATNEAPNDVFNTSEGYSLSEEQNNSQAANSIFKTYTSDDYSLIDTSTFQQAQMPTIMSQSQSQSRYSGFANSVSSLHLH